MRGPEPYVNSIYGGTPPLFELIFALIFSFNFHREHSLLKLTIKKLSPKLNLKTIKNRVVFFFFFFFLFFFFVFLIMVLADTAQSIKHIKTETERKP